MAKSKKRELMKGEKELDLSPTQITALKKKYSEAVDKKQHWIDFQDRKMSRNFVTYVLNYYAEP